jgi:hypothetical protein
MYQIAANFSNLPCNMNTKLSQNIPNGHKIYQNFPFQCPPKFTKVGISGMKINHLATPAPEQLPFLLGLFNVGGSVQLRSSEQHQHKQQRRQQQLKKAGAIINYGYWPCLVQRSSLNLLFPQKN